jgi:hypothetical protein
MGSEDLADLGGRLAAVPGDIRPAVAQGLRSLEEVGVVTAGIAPATFGRVSRESIEFDADAVVFVEVVQIADAAAVPALGLAPGSGQPVSAFYAVNVAVFERGVDAVGGIV